MASKSSLLLRLLKSKSKSQPKTLLPRFPLFPSPPPPSLPKPLHPKLPFYPYTITPPSLPKLPFYPYTITPPSLPKLPFYPYTNTPFSTQPQPNLKHQEIEGPTVDRDLSPLANETRQVTHNLIKTTHTLSTFLGLLSLSQLAIGAYISYSHSSTLGLTTVVGFALPFSMAFLLRRSTKSMGFFYKMEDVGRLRILTSTMQIVKQIHLLFSRLRVVVALCLLCSPLPFIPSFISHSNSSS